MFDVLLNFSKSRLIAKLEDVAQIPVGALERLDSIQHQLQAGMVISALPIGLNAVIAVC